jgi:serine/threonine protein kinase
MAQLKPLEIDRECVSILTELGEGQFGKVFEASATGLHEHKGRAMTVAVKFLNDDHMDEQHTFIEEAVRMSRLKHARIVQLLAVCFESAPFFIVLEHMSNGDLKGFLAKNKHKFDGSRRKIDVHGMVRMCWEVASALAFMSAAKYVHRDLAARNVLVAADESLKLGDFGLSRGVYTTEYYRKQGGGMLPLRYMLH